MDILLLRLDAPLMSFGGPAVDGRGPTERVPARSMLAGLFANALGYDHRDFALTQALQDRLHFAARCDAPGERTLDYQTVDLGHEHLLDDRAWTTWGRRQERGGSGANKTGTHIRRREFLADACYTLAVTLVPASPAAPDQPDLEALAQALVRPARPLFLGRKSCLPASPLLLGRSEAPDLESALRTAPFSPRAAAHGAPAQSTVVLDAWLPTEPAERASLSPLIEPVTDERDWHNQIHVGTRYWRRTRLTVSAGIDPHTAPDTATGGAPEPEVSP